MATRTRSQNTETSNTAENVTSSPRFTTRYARLARRSASMPISSTERDASSSAVNDSPAEFSTALTKQSSHCPTSCYGRPVREWLDTQQRAGSERKKSATLVLLL